MLKYKRYIQCHIVEAEQADMLAEDWQIVD